MKKNIICKIKSIYPKWYYLAITFVCITFVIGFIFGVIYDFKDGYLGTILRSVASVFILGGGCSYISILSWRKYPWEQVPLKHLIFETCLILLLILFYICIFNFIEISSNHSDFWDNMLLYRIDIVITFLITFLITTIHEAIMFYQQWKHHFSKSIQLEKDKLEVSYNALKSQVNPHFLFNSLNSLMSLLENNQQAEQYVQDLSDFLRYILLSNERELDSVEEEITYLEKYIHLQKLRFNDNLKIGIDIDTESLASAIPTLTIQMLVENCIKHNVISEKHPLLIQVYNDEKSITVVNNLQRKQVGESTGKGLQNIEGRYRFVTGESVIIDITDTEFKVTIPILKNR